MKQKQDQYYYNSEEYAERIAEVQAEAAIIRQEMAEEAEQKKKEVTLEVRRLKKIYTKDRCGEHSMHTVISLIERAAFLRVELAHMEKKLQEEGMMDFFIQGTQKLWREHPLSRIHNQHSKSYRETIKLLDSYDKTSDTSSSAATFGLNDLIQKGNAARNKYKK